jgi:hypothetical protein
LWAFRGCIAQEGLGFCYGGGKNPIPTPQGAKLLAKALPAVERADIAFFAKLNAQEADLLLKTLSR